MQTIIEAALIKEKNQNACLYWLFPISSGKENKIDVLVLPFITSIVFFKELT